MMGRLHRAWGARAPRERVALATLVLLSVPALCLWFLLAAGQERAQLQAHVAALRIESQRFDRAARDYARLQSAPVAMDTGADLRALVQSRIDAAGLTRALVSIEAPEAGQVVLAFGVVRFADWLDWVAGLAAQHVRLATCRIDALSTPGLISVTATLVRADHK